MVPDAHLPTCKCDYMTNYFMLYMCALSLRIAGGLKEKMGKNIFSEKEIATIYFNHFHNVYRNYKSVMRCD